MVEERSISCLDYELIAPPARTHRGVGAVWVLPVVIISILLVAQIVASYVVEYQ